MKRNAGTRKDKPEAAVTLRQTRGSKHPSEGKASKEHSTAETSLCELGENTFPLFYVSWFQTLVMASPRKQRRDV